MVFQYRENRNADISKVTDKLCYIMLYQNRESNSQAFSGIRPQWLHRQLFIQLPSDCYHGGPYVLEELVYSKYV
jgi:hypothetical protein